MADIKVKVDSKKWRFDTVLLGKKFVCGQVIQLYIIKLYLKWFVFKMAGRLGQFRHIKNGGYVYILIGRRQAVWRLVQLVAEVLIN